MPQNAVEASQAAYRLAVAVEQAVASVVPGLVDLRVAAVPGGAVTISARLSTRQVQERVEEVARAVVGVSRVTGDFTVL